MDDIKFKAKLEQAKTDAIQKYIKLFDSKISQEKILKCAKNGKNKLLLYRFTFGETNHHIIKAACTQLSNKYPDLKIYSERGSTNPLLLMIATLLVIPLFILLDKYPVDVYVTWK
jgi:hypothetical protein